jgi:hypothetical protein
MPKRFTSFQKKLSLPDAPSKDNSIFFRKDIVLLSPEQDIEPCGTGLHW